MEKRLVAGSGLRDFGSLGDAFGDEGEGGPGEIESHAQIILGLPAAPGVGVAQARMLSILILAADIGQRL